MKTLGEKIKYLRNLKGWSQDEMADKLNISLPAYSKIERNITDINYSRMLQIAKVFGQTLPDLVNLSGKSTNEAELQKLLAEKEKEIMQLQKKVIDLLEKKKE